MPLYQLSVKDNDTCTVAIWQIAESEEEMVAPMPCGKELLAEARARFKADGRRLEWLAVRRLMHEVGCHSPIKYHPSGRPYLEEDERYISISHTRGYAAIALHLEKSVGLDIEQRTDRVCRVREKFLSHEEKLFLPLEKKNVETMLIIWTVKEAMFKLMDKEGVDFARHLHVSPFEVAGEGSLVAHETLTNEQCAYQFSYQIYPDFVLSLGSLMA
ncbi:MAG: 4'-phosphopantetheinyl transferase superfamily protein [Bacteroidaceae bacterium]|nr:4'-phosphopantetheinyl transferase superfamily protein [Bacteroidaceae bacterium]